MFKQNMPEPGRVTGLLPELQALPGHVLQLYILLGALGYGDHSRHQSTLAWR